MKNKFIKLAAAVLTMILLLSSCKSNVDNNIIVRVKDCIPLCEFVDTSVTSGNDVIYNFRTENGVPFTATASGGGMITVDYYYSMLKSKSDEIELALPEGITVSIGYLGIALLIENVDYLDDAAEFCAKVESMFDIMIDIPDSDVIIDDVQFIPLLFCEDCGEYISLVYTADIISSKESRLGYEGMYEFLEKSYTLAAENGMHFTAADEQ